MEQTEWWGSWSQVPFFLGSAPGEAVRSQRGNGFLQSLSTNGPLPLKVSLPLRDTAKRLCEPPTLNGRAVLQAKGSFRVTQLQQMTPHFPNLLDNGQCKSLHNVCPNPGLKRETKTT